MSGHPDMPEFKFDADDVGAIIAYLKSIQRLTPRPHNPEYPSHEQRPFLAL